MQTERPEPSMLEALNLQASACDALGSTIYSAALSVIKSDYLANGLCKRLLDAVHARPVRDAVPLRLLSALHQLALNGTAPELAANFPTCCGQPKNDLTVTVLTAISKNEDFVSQALKQNVQTNETGRSRALITGLAWIGRKFGIDEVQLFEMGASAGLNLCAGLFRFENPTGATGPDDALISFTDGWLEPFAPLKSTPEIVDIHGCDVTPIDITKEVERIRLLSFVWPDQIERFARLKSAIDIARNTTFTIDAEDAAPWIDRRLKSHGTGARVAWHSIAWQYFPTLTKDGVRKALIANGEVASVDNPLFWLRMEPAGAHADLRVTVWAGGPATELVLASVGYHGMDLKWLAD